MRFLKSFYFNDIKFVKKLALIYPDGIIKAGIKNARCRLVFEDTAIKGTYLLKYISLFHGTPDMDYIYLTKSELSQLKSLLNNLDLE